MACGRVIFDNSQTVAGSDTHRSESVRVGVAASEAVWVAESLGSCDLSELPGLSRQYQRGVVN